MERAFKYFHTPSEQETDELWSTAFFTFDSSSLLNLYSFSPSGRDELFASMRKLKSEGRIWLAHQVGQEFHRHRPYVARDSSQAIQQTKQSLTTFLKTFKKIVKVHDDAGELLGAIESAERHLDAYVAKHSAAGKSNPTPEADSVLLMLEGIFDQPEMVGLPLDKDRLSAIYAEGRYRFAAAIPPGYKDNEKPEPWCFGDLVVWKQLLERAKSAQQPAILITDDTKDDWTFRDDGRDHFVPHPMLREEFQRETGHGFWLYTTEEFLKQARSRQLSTVSDDTIVEARESRVVETATTGAVAYSPFNRLDPSRKVLDSLSGLDFNPHLDIIERLSKMYISPSWRTAVGDTLADFADPPNVVGSLPFTGLAFYDNPPMGSDNQEPDSGTQDEPGDSELIDAEAERRKDAESDEQE